MALESEEFYLKNKKVGQDFFKGKKDKHKSGEVKTEQMIP